MATFTASVPTSGMKVDLALTAGVAIDSSKFNVVADGVVMELGTATGSSAAWSLPLTVRSGWIPAGATVTVSCVNASGVTNESVTATNSSTITKAQQRYVERGFGNFVHLVPATWAASPSAFVPTSLAEVNAIDMPSYNMEQWFTSVIIPSGARYAVFTAKHYQGLSWWNSAAGNFDISDTAFGATNPSADLVRDWVRLCRKYGLGVGVYFCFGDMWWTTNHGLPYSNPGYIPYITQQITELMSNYGKLDMFWCDLLGQIVSYAEFPWANVTALRDSLQPGCMLLTNNQELTLTHCDLVTIELPAGGVIPATTNTLPSEVCTDCRTDQLYVWNASNENSYVDVYAVFDNLIQTRAGRSAYLFNFPPNKFGVMPTSTGTFASQLGGIVGKRGANPVLPSMVNVRSGIDRGDGQMGAFGGGVNSSTILGVA